MLKLITELLNLSESQKLDSSDPLFEDLGNLKDLHLGSLVNAFKQTYARAVSHGRDASYSGASEVGNKINRTSFKLFNTGLDIGPDSEMVNFKVRDFADVRKQMREQTSSVVAFYEGNAPQTKALALIIDPNGHVSQPSQYIGFAWDLSRTSLSADKQQELLSILALGTRGDNSYYRSTSNISTSPSTSAVSGVDTTTIASWDKETALKKAGKEIKEYHDKPYTAYEDWVDDSKALADNRHPVTITKSDDENIAHYGAMGSSNYNPIGAWDKKASKGYIRQYKAPFNDNIKHVYGNVKNYVGVSATVLSVKKFIDALAKEIRLHGQAVKGDLNAQAKMVDRRNNPPISPANLSLFTADIKTRLAKYKNSKLITVADAKEFIEKVFEGGMKKINLAGKTYIASVSEYSNDKGVLQKLINGRPFDVEFETDRISGYHSLTLTMSNTKGTLVPIKAEYYDENNKKVVQKF